MIAHLRDGTERHHTIGQAMGAPAVESFELREPDIVALLRMPDEHIREYLRILVMRFPPNLHYEEVPDASL